MSVADWVTAAVTTCAAGIVCWQSWETRRSANASEAASRVANEGLELARAEELHTRRLIAEGVKARIDEATPVVTVLLDPRPAWPPLEPSLMANGQAQPVAEGDRVYRLPKEQHLKVIVRQGFELVNDSSRTVLLDMSPWTDAFDIDCSGEFALSPGDRIRGTFDVVRSVGGWVTIAESRAAGDPGAHAVFSFVLNDPVDTGATDRYQIHTGGSPVEAVTDETGAWRVPGVPSEPYGYPMIRSVVLPRERIYWLSKSSNERLE